MKVALIPAVFATLALAAFCPAQVVRTRFIQRNNAGGNTIPFKSAVLKDGSYVTLNTVSRGGRSDSVLACFATNGATKWVKTLWAQGSFNPGALLPMKNGNVFVCGFAYQQETGFSYSYCTVVQPNGASLWSFAHEYGNGGGAYAAALDPSDNIYVTGSGKTGGRETAYALKLNPLGQQQYLTYFPWSPTNTYQGDMIAVDHDGGVMIDIDSAPDFYWRVSPTGQSLWSKAHVNGMGPSDFRYDTSNNLYLAGGYRNSATDYAPAVQKLDTDGKLIWTRIFNFEGDELDFMNQFAFDTVGNIVAAGRVFYLGQSRNFFLTRITPAGVVAYTRLYNSPGNTNDDLYNLFVDSRNQNYLVGYHQGSPDGSYAVGTDSAGTKLWQMITPGASDPRFYFQSSVFNPTNGDLFVGGEDSVSGDAVYYCYSQMAVGKPESHTVAKNGTLNPATSVLANDYYAADGTAIQSVAPLHGTLTLNANGTFTYKPDTNYTGTDTFKYKIRKTGLSDSAAVTVTITVG